MNIPNERRKKMDILPGIAIFFSFVNFYFSPYEFKRTFFDSKQIFSEKLSTLVDFHVFSVLNCVDTILHRFLFLQPENRATPFFRRKVEEENKSIFQHFSLQGEKKTNAPAGIRTQVTQIYALMP